MRLTKLLLNREPLGKTEALWQIIYSFAPIAIGLIALAIYSLDNLLKKIF